MHVFRQTPLWSREDMRILVNILSLVLLSGFAGSGLALRFATWHHPAPQVNSSLFLAIASPSQSQTQQAVNVLTDERIQELKQDAQASLDDRKLIHDEIFKLAQIENSHFAALHEQLSVDEARLNGSTAVIGGGVTILNAIALWFQISDRRRRKKETTP